MSDHQTDTSPSSKTDESSSTSASDESSLPALPQTASVGLSQPSGDGGMAPPTATAADADAGVDAANPATATDAPSDGQTGSSPACFLPVEGPSEVRSSGGAATATDGAAIPLVAPASSNADGNRSQREDLGSDRSQSSGDNHETTEASSSNRSERDSLSSSETVESGSHRGSTDYKGSVTASDTDGQGAIGRQGPTSDQSLDKLAVNANDRLPPSHYAIPYSRGTTAGLPDRDVGNLEGETFRNPGDPRRFASVSDGHMTVEHTPDAKRADVEHPDVKRTGHPDAENAVHDQPAAPKHDQPAAPKHTEVKPETTELNGNDNGNGTVGEVVKEVGKGVLQSDLNAVKEAVSSFAGINPALWPIEAAKTAVDIATAKTPGAHAMEVVKDKVTGVFPILAVPIALAEGGGILEAGDAVMKKAPFGAAAEDLDKTVRAVNRGDIAAAVTHGGDGVRHFGQEWANVVVAAHVPRGHEVGTVEIHREQEPRQPHGQISEHIVPTAQQRLITHDPATGMAVAATKEIGATAEGAEALINGGKPIGQGPPQTFVTSAETAGQLPAAAPDPSAVSSGSQFYYADQSGRPLGAEGWVYTRAGSARATGSAAVQQATTGGAPGLQGAHLYADRFGGAPIGSNIVPFSADANLSSMKVVENAIADYAASGRDVYLQVYPQYADQGAIPATVTYRIWTPGPTGDLVLTDQFAVDFENNLVWTEPPPAEPTVH